MPEGFILLVTATTPTPGPMLTCQEVISAFPAEVLAKYDFNQAVYTGALSRIQNVRCPVHGAFSQYSAQFRKGRGCPACGAVTRTMKRQTPADDYFANVTEIHGGKYDYSGSVFVKMNAPITFGCPVHGAVTMVANHHYYRKQGCGQCESEAKKSRIVKYRHLSSQSKIDNTAKAFFARCVESHEGKYTYPEQTYHGAKEKIRAVCPVHGEFQQAAWAHLSGKGCPSCGSADPKWERELLEFLQGFGLEVQRSARVLDGRHIDLFVPSRNFGVELHGLHWHTERTRDKQYHRRKWEVAQQKGIRLLQVMEDEWNAKSEVVKARIAAVLGTAPKFDARKLLIEVLSATESKAFIDTHHIQGATVAQRHYGLRAKDGTLLAVATFGRSRSGAMTGAQNPHAWEVLRYASIGRVRGGFTRLLSRFMADVAPQELISYCDLRYGDGRLYAAAGFTCTGVTEPDYWWVPHGKVIRVPRYATQKHKIASHPVLSKHYSPEKTEVEICHAAGWARIYGVGHQRWFWRCS